MSRRIFTTISLSLVAVAIAWLLLANRGPSPRTVAKPDQSANHPRPAKLRLEVQKNQWSVITQDNLPRHQRLDLVHQITENLDSEDTAILFSTMRHVPASGSEADWYVILNELMGQMSTHGVGADQYSTHLGELIADTSLPEVVRDYAIQHLASWIAPPTPDQVPHEQDPELIRQSLAHIVTALQDPAAADTSIPGTALLMLTDISANLPEEVTAPSWQTLEPFLSGLFADEISTSLPTQVSAIQAVGRTGQEQYLPVIRDFAATESTDPSLRLSSIASLGFYGSPADHSLLKQIASQNTRFRFAAQAALERFPQP